MKMPYSPSELDAKMLPKGDQELINDIITDLEDEMMNQYAPDIDEYYLTLDRINETCYHLIQPIESLFRNKNWKYVATIYPNEDNDNKFILHIRRKWR